ncbi:hypothetical protein D3C75_243620 [compost metagenome]
MLQHGKIVEAAQIRVLRLELRQHLLGDAVHTADCRDNEQIITDADLAVGTAVALEGEVAFRIGNRVKLRDIIVFFLTYEIRFDVMRVNPIAGCDRGNRVPDRIAVFGDDVILVKGCQGDLVPLRNILSCLYRQPVDFKLLTGGNRTQSYSNCIAGIHFH